MRVVEKYKINDLVLDLKQSVDKNKLNLDKWRGFIDAIAGGRGYQEDAIIKALIFLASGNYTSIKDVAEENFDSNDELQKVYKDLPKYLNKFLLADKLSAVIDLATGTGKSYVMYAISQIALGIGLVDKVLILCPTRTIKWGLEEKFKDLSTNSDFQDLIPGGAKFRHPEIINADKHISDGSICIENVHAIYKNTNSSIRESLKASGGKTLILNDEAHHIYSSNRQDAKEWKKFLQDDYFNFKFILGFTGTAYIEDDYFCDVIYRYSLRQAVFERMVKQIDYLTESESDTENQKFQEIYDNHEEMIRKYRRVKPLTILITKDISGAKLLEKKLIDFLMEKEDLPFEAIQKKVLTVTSDKKHQNNLITLRKVDDKKNSTEWIVSVSMLSEGWDVKNVFQIVPWEDRAFKSKLLIAQVLGRGLRVPSEYKSPQPSVRVFNHSSWDHRIRELVDAVLEKELRLESSVLHSGERAKYNFDVYNIDYKKSEKEFPATEKTRSFDYTKGYVDLVAQNEEEELETSYRSLNGKEYQKSTHVLNPTYDIDEVLQKVARVIRTKAFEATIKFPNGEYTYKNPPPESEIREIIQKSMSKVGITSGRLNESNANRIYSAFQTIFRQRASTIHIGREFNKLKKKSTKDLEKMSISVDSLRQESTVYYTENFMKECSGNTLEALKDVIENKDDLKGSACRETNFYNFKTPCDIAFTSFKPERKFADILVKPDVSGFLDAWIKSRDRGFYALEYSWMKGTHSKTSNFNPDFFLKIGEKMVVVETKSDTDTTDETRAKYKAGKKHFKKLNEELKEAKIKQEYFFHVISPSSYSEFQTYLLDGRLFERQFKSDLENLLEQ